MPHHHLDFRSLFYILEEVENLEVQLGEEEKKLRALQEDHSKTMTEQKQSNTLISSLKSRNKDNQQTINELQGELQAKTDLVRNKWISDAIKQNKLF